MSSRQGNGGMGNGYGTMPSLLDKSFQLLAIIEDFTFFSLLSIFLVSCEFFPFLFYLYYYYYSDVMLDVPSMRVGEPF